MYNRLNAMFKQKQSDGTESWRAVSFPKGQNDLITTIRSNDSIRCRKETLSELQKYYPRSRCYRKSSVLISLVKRT